ncbi:MAG: ABC transporter substrate-binding protein [Deltaproteobacteria bacterium]|nr:ABC transporter substrate-binding protein [Deltaproteobacteria bacterium]
MKREKSVFVLITMVFFLLTLSSPPAMAADKVFKLGILAPLTGPAGKPGTEMKNGATMAIEKAGNKIGDYKIELVYIDDQSDAAKATNALSEAIERQGVQAAILDWNTAVTVACFDVFNKYKVPYLFGMGGGKAANDKWLAQPENRYMIMKGWPIPQKRVTGYIECLNNAIKKGAWKPEKKLGALWGEDTDWGRSLVKGMSEGMKANGWEVFTEEYFALTQTDFYPFLSKCKEAGVTALMGTTSSTASVSALVKQSNEIGIKAVLAADGVGWIGDWYKLIGPASDGILDMIPQISTPGQKAFAEEYQKKFGYAPSPSAAGHAFDYANFFLLIAKKAIEKYGKLDSESVYKISVDEVIPGKLTFSAADGALFHKRYGTTPQDAPDPKIGQDDFYFPVIQYKGGVGKIVFPESAKETDLVFK